MSLQQFVPSDVWKAENFTSRKHMKDTMYDRAKVSTTCSTFCFVNLC